MFWVNYKDIAPYMTGAKEQLRNFDNVAYSSTDDFFVPP